MLPLRYLNPFLLTWLEAHEHRQDPGEKVRKIENFIGENEHLSQIIGGRPVCCQNLINRGRRGKVTSRYYRGGGISISLTRIYSLTGICSAGGGRDNQKGHRGCQKRWHPDVASIYNLVIFLQVGDVIVERVTEVGRKRRHLDVASTQAAILMLSSGTHTQREAHTQPHARTA